jgi:hypothetical protein
MPRESRGAVPFDLQQSIISNLVPTSIVTYDLTPPGPGQPNLGNRDTGHPIHFREEGAVLGGLDSVSS